MEKLKFGNNIFIFFEFNDYLNILNSFIKIKYIKYIKQNNLLIL